jgi:hypothetical protein
MEFEEFTKHLTDLVGGPLPDLFNSPEPSIPDPPQSEKP